jgi:hypothetical protein
LAAVAAEAQTADSDFFTRYYQDPEPARLADYLAEFGSEDWRSYPPLAGFLAIIFQADPDAATALSPPDPSPKLAATLVAALQLSGHGERARDLGSRAGQLFNEKLIAEFSDLPERIEALEIATPTHLDIVWGAAYASGDPRYPQMIINFLAGTTERSEQVAIDVTALAIAMMGGPDTVAEKMPEMKLREKYDEAAFLEVTYAAVALWALQSNARRHPFIAAVVLDAIAANPDSLTSKAMSTLMPDAG